MGFRYAEGVKENVANKPASPATAFELAGAVSAAYRTIVAGIGGGSRSVFKAQKVDAAGNPAGAWEIFVGTVTDGTPDTLSRDHLISSTTGAFIDWSTSGENSAPHISIVHPAGIGDLGFGPVMYQGSGDVWHSPVFGLGAYVFANIEVAIWGSMMVVPRPALLTGLRCQVGSGGANRFLRMGLYRQVGFASDPMELVAASAEKAVTGAGIISDTTLSVFVPPGTYWTVVHPSHNDFSVFGYGPSSGEGGAEAKYVYGTLEGSGTHLNGSFITVLRFNRAYQPLPATVTFNDTRGLNAPIVQAKFSPV